MATAMATTSLYIDTSSDDQRDSYVIEDQDSFSADASADDGGADSFG